MPEITDYIEKINNKQSLSVLESYNAFISIMSGNCVDDDISNFLIGLKSGSVILYKKLPIILTKLLCVLMIPKAMSQLKIA